MRLCNSQIWLQLARVASLDFVHLANCWFIEKNIYDPITNLLTLAERDLSLGYLAIRVARLWSIKLMKKYKVSNSFDLEIVSVRAEIRSRNSMELCKCWSVTPTPWPALPIACEPSPLAMAMALVVSIPGWLAGSRMNGQARPGRPATGSNLLECKGKAVICLKAANK